MPRRSFKSRNLRARDVLAPASESGSGMAPAMTLPEPALVLSPPPVAEKLAEPPKLPRRYDHHETSSFWLLGISFRRTKHIVYENLTPPAPESHKREFWAAATHTVVSGITALLHFIWSRPK